MSDKFEPAKVTDVRAVYFNGKLTISASGDKPDEGYTVRIRHSPVLILPPSRDYFVEWSKTGPGADVITSYSVEAAFSGPFASPICVHTVDGVKEVSVWLIHSQGGDPAIEAGAVAKFAALAAPIEGKAEGDVSPLEKLKVRSGRGYSDKYDLGEAIADAIKNMPDGNKPPAIDWLQNYTVSHIGVEKGGIAGLDRLVVQVDTIEFH